MFLWREVGGQVRLSQGQGWVTLKQGTKRLRPGSSVAISWQPGTLLRPPTHLTAEAQATLGIGLVGVGALGAGLVVVGNRVRASAAGSYLYRYARRYGLPLLDLHGVFPAGTPAPASGEQLIAYYLRGGRRDQPPARLYVLNRGRVHEVLGGWRRREHEANAGPIPPAAWATVAQAFHQLCVMCGVAGKLTADHILPISRGGLSTADNLQPLCGPCNSRKGDLTLDLRVAAHAWWRWQLVAQAAVGSYPFLELYQAVAAYVDAYLGLATDSGWMHTAWANGDREAYLYSRKATVVALQTVGLGRAATMLDQLWQMFAAGDKSQGVAAGAKAMELRRWLATTGLRRLGRQ